MNDDELKRLVELPATIRMGTIMDTPVDPAPDVLITQHGEYIKISHRDWYKAAWEASQKREVELEYALEMHVPNHPALEGGQP